MFKNNFQNIREDLTGQKFNSLVAIRFSHMKNNGSYWIFRCDCGKEKTIKAGNVKYGNPKSCGCLKKIKAQGRPKKPKKVKILKGRGKLITYNNKTQNFTQWAKELNISPITLSQKLQQGLSLEQIFDLKNKQKEKECIVGDSYGELTAIKYIGNGIWKWKCSCGVEIENTAIAIRNKKDKSCGHYRIKCQQLRCRWSSMRKRCYDKNHTGYSGYGGRGIYICKEWLNDCKKFYKWAFDNGFKPHLECDRIDNDGPYSPENCRWISRKENSLNRRTNHRITHKDKTQTLKEWSEELDIEYRILASIIKSGYKIEDIDGQLDVVGLKGEKCKLQLINKNPQHVSSLHIKTKNLLQEIFPNINKYEEVSLPKSSIKNGVLRCDFLIPDKNIIVEIDGEQHYNETKIFNNGDFEYQKLRDKNKEKWAELNNFKLIRLRFDETEEEWKNKIITQV